MALSVLRPKRMMPPLYRPRSRARSEVPQLELSLARGLAGAMLESARPNGRRLAVHMINAPRVAAACALAGLAACSPGPSATSSLAPPPAEEHLDAGDWPSYNRDLAGTRFSPLDQIDASNVAELKQAWVYPLGRNTTTGSLSGGSETTPIVIGGALFVPAARPRAASHGRTGARAL